MAITRTILCCIATLVAFSSCVSRPKSAGFAPATEEQFQQLKSADYCSRMGYFLAAAEFSRNAGLTYEAALKDPTATKISTSLAERHALEDLVAGVYQGRSWRNSTYEKNLSCAKENPEMVETSYALAKKALSDFLKQ